MTMMGAGDYCAMQLTGNDDARTKSRKGAKGENFEDQMAATWSG